MTAVVLRFARSEPPLGSVIAIAVTISPVQKPGSQRSRCSSVVSSIRYGATMSAWMPRHEEIAADTFDCSSATTAMNR